MRSCIFFLHSGANGRRVTGGNVQLSSDQKTLTLELQLEETGQAGGSQGPSGRQGGLGAAAGSQSGGIGNYVPNDNDTLKSLS